MAVAHLVGGVLLIATAYQRTFWPIFVLLFLYCNLYMPTMGLTNSITFRSLGEAHQDRFPGIRFWGTIGWIAAGPLVRGLPRTPGASSAFQPLFDLVGEPSHPRLPAGGGRRLDPLRPLLLRPAAHARRSRPRRTDHGRKKSAVLESLELMRQPLVRGPGRRRRA